MKWILLVFLLAALAWTATACGGGVPTPTPKPSPTILASPTVPPTKAPPPATPTTAPSPTPVPPTPTAAPPTATATRTRVPATPRPTATATPAKPPAPRGSIAYHINRTGIDSLFVLNLETNVTTPLIDVGPVMDLVEGTNAKIGSWSPDNSKFAYIFTGAPNTANVLRVLERDTTTPLYSSDSGGGLSSPSWSPDGKRIAFVKMSADKSAWYIIIVNADGSRCTSDRFECLIRQVPGEQYRGGLAWSKQGLLAVGFNTTGANEVHAVYSDGSGSQNLTNHEADDGSPAWSPDGKQIAFTSTRDGAPQIYVMNADGSGVRRVSQSNVPDFQPAWSPDGNWIAFSSTRNNQTNVYIMDLRGGNVTQLTKNGGDHPTWSH